MDQKFSSFFLNGLFLVQYHIVISYLLYKMKKSKIMTKRFLRVKGATTL